MWTVSLSRSRQIKRCIQIMVLVQCRKVGDKSGTDVEFYMSQKNRIDWTWWEKFHLNCLSTSCLSMISLCFQKAIKLSSSFHITELTEVFFFPKPLGVHITSSSSSSPKRPARMRRFEGAPWRWYFALGPGFPATWLGGWTWNSGRSYRPGGSGWSKHSFLLVKKTMKISTV